MEIECYVQKVKICGISLEPSGFWAGWAEETIDRGWRNHKVAALRGQGKENQHSVLMGTLAKLTDLA